MSEHEPTPFVLRRGVHREPIRSFMVPFVMAEVTETGQAKLHFPPSVRERLRVASLDAPQVGERVTAIISDWLTGAAALYASQAPLPEDLKNRGCDENH